VNYKTRKPLLKNVTGGLSGPAIKPIALAKVWEVYNAVKIPIVGMGGITNFDDAMEFFLVGASAVQIGTMNFVNPTIGTTVAEQIEQYFSNETHGRFKDFIGSLKI
jgi:dihydroorotate dehydrogenase (NAD+) catalytic subunit